MLPCVWYISQNVRPWEQVIIGSMASALRSGGETVFLCVEGGTAELDPLGASSWKALTGTERFRRILFPGGRIWHLWGNPPLWWGWVRLFARTVHTSFDEMPLWRGQPTRLFWDQASGGENLIVPAIEARLSGKGNDEGASPTIYLSFSQASPSLRAVLDGLGYPLWDLDTKRLDLHSAKSGLLISGGTPSCALRAALLTLQGLTVVGCRSPYLDSLLSREGYFSLEKDSEELWRCTLQLALSEHGRSLATLARHFVKEHCSAAESAASLKALYSKVLRSNS